MKRLAVLATTLAVLVTLTIPTATGQERKGSPDDPPIPDKALSNPGLSNRLLPDPAIGGRSEGPTGQGLVTVEILTEPGRMDAAVAAVRAEGGTAERVGDIVVTSLPIGALVRLSDDDSISWIQPASRPVPEAITAESVGFVDAFEWHEAGHTGLGVSVGIIDLGFEDWDVVRDAGELPASVHTKNYCSDFEDGRHGTAVAEIVHDLAPDARLHLICVDTTADLLAAVGYADEHGISILTHSVGWFNTGPGNGTGTLGAVVDAATAAGVTWVNSSGNYAENHWAGTFDNTDADVDEWHDFSPGDNDLSFTLGAGDSVSVFLKWNDWPVSSNDFDVYLFKDDGGAYNLVSGAQGADPQNGFQQPTEVIEYTNFDTGDTFYLRIQKYSATGTPDFDLFVLGPDDLEYVEAARSINDLAGAPDVVAVGAVCHSASSPFCGGVGTIESYSSQGPNIDGVIKPDVTAPSGISTAAYGLGGFYGTSAAAPGAAGVAALLKGADRCGTTGDLAGDLDANVVDGGVPGDDPVYGAGILLLDDPVATSTLLRHDGRDRYRTAEAISQRSHPCGADIVYIATGDNFPDAIAGGPAAAEETAPLLLVLYDKVPNATRQELQRLDPELVVVLGGTGAISGDTFAEIASIVPGAAMERRWGSNRYSTAVAVSEAVYASGQETVYVTTGEDFFGALITAPAAVSTFSSLILVRFNGLKSYNRAELERLNPAEIVIVGDTTYLPGTVRDELDGIAPTRRISAPNRYALSAAVSADTWPDGARTVYIAVGDNYPDALAAGPLTWTANGPLLLVETNSLPTVVANELDRLNPSRIVILGGTGVVSEAVANAIAAYQE